MRRMVIHLTDYQFERIKRIASRIGVSYAEIIRRAVDEYLGIDLKREAREELRNEDAEGGDIEGAGNTVSRG